MPAWAVNSPSLEQAMRNFGLIGEWAADCSELPSKNNAYTHWSARTDTTGELFTDFGGGVTMSYSVNAAELVGADQILIRLVDDKDHTHLELIIEMRDGRVRTLSSVASDGSAFIKDGKFVSSGADTVAQEHCR